MILKFNKDFFCGYSPERINPGDKEHTVTKILKVTSGSTPQIGEKIDKLYASIITAGTHLARTIKVAEAAKVIENSQRDINIAFVNELALIFDKLGIDTNEVLEAAGTKWNFLKFKPGLVGGHCQIGTEYITIKEKNRIKTYTFKEFNQQLQAKEINYFGTNFKFPNKKIEVLSFTPDKGFEFKEAKVFTQREYDSFVEITTSLGDKVVFSDKHPFIVKENNEYNVKLADEIKIGDEIPVISKLPTIYKNQQFNLIDLFKDRKNGNKRDNQCSTQYKDKKSMIKR